MSFKTYFKSFSYFNLVEGVKIGIAIIARKISQIAPLYGLQSKTYFDFYQDKNIDIVKANDKNIITFRSSNSGNDIKFSIRRGTTDILIFDEILLKGGYAPLLKICDTLNVSPKVIVDAGANIGCFTVYISDIFNDSAIICIEPEPGNIFQLKRNVELNNLSKVVIIEGGLWNEDCKLGIKEGFRGNKERELSFSLGEAENAMGMNVKCYSLDSIMKLAMVDHIDILKIDIEGAEANLFSSFKDTLSILSKVSVLAIELHDESIDRFLFTNFLDLAGYSHISFGEITYVYKKP